MANDFFERVLNPTWKNLSRESKEVVIRNILRFFVNPILTIEDLKFVQYDYAGITNDTFEVTIDGRVFVFVPGQKEVVLGWDSGLSGLSGLDCSEERQELRYAFKRYLNQHVTGFMFLNQNVQEKDLSSEKLTTQIVEDGINLIPFSRKNLHAIRKVDIPAMLVEKKPNFVGLKFIGHYSVVTGQIDGEDMVSSETLSILEEAITPDNSLEALFQEFPRAVRVDQYFMQDIQNPDLFACYVADPVSYDEGRKEIERTGMGLLNEDEWEYCCGSGTRRLFKWGNQLHRTLLQDEFKSPLWQENMFGLEIANAEFGPEIIEGRPYTKGAWLEENFKAPVLNLLPLSSYYSVNLPLFVDPNGKLAAGYYCIRRAIRIEM